MTRDHQGIARAAAFVLAVFTSTHAFGITSTFVQDKTAWNNTANWANGDQPTVPTTGGGTIPNAVGDVAIFQQKVNSTLGAGSTHNISLGTGTMTVGQILVRNTDNEYTTAVATGTLVFDNGGSSATAVLTELEGTGTSNQSRFRMNLPVVLNSNLEINQNHNLRRNSATEFVQLISSSTSGLTMTKNGAGNVQFAYGGALVNPTDGFQGVLDINDGAVRLINGTGSTNTVFGRATGIRVENNAQFQLGNGVTSFSIGEVSPGVKGEIVLNGLGNDNPNPDFTFNEGALRFEQSATFRFVCDFNSPIRLETQSRIFVTAADTTAKLNEEVRGDDLAGINKGGPGLLKLTTTSANGNTYAGNTNVSNGGLAVNNTVATASGVGSGDVFVNNGGRVGGTGTIGKTADPSNVSVSDGTLSPGDLSIDSSSGLLIEHAGTLTVHGDVSLTDDSFFNINLGSTFDQLVAGGAIDLGGSTLNLALGAFVPDGVQSFTLISNTGAGSISDLFGTINIDGVAAASPDLNLNGETYHLSYAAGVGSNDLVLLPGATPVGLDGDYNDDGIVDAADYVIWRKGGSLENDTPPAGAGPEDYDKWFEQFGTGGMGSGGSLSGNAAVPEPTTGLLVAVALCGFMAVAKRR